MDFDLNALFSKAIQKDESSAKKVKEVKKAEEEAKKAEFKIDTSMDSVKMYEKINKKFIKDGRIVTDKEGIDALKEFATEPAKFEEKISSKSFLLDKFAKPRANYKQAEKLKLISSKFKKEKKLFAIPPEKVKYDLFLKLNTLWKEYIEDLVSKERLPENMFNKLLKADYHGAIIKILESKCGTYEGISGIVVMETMRSFKIITPDNRLLTILKQNVVFMVEVLKKNIKIYGCHLIYRPADRMKTKFRLRYLENIV